MVSVASPFASRPATQAPSSRVKAAPSLPDLYDGDLLTPCSVRQLREQVEVLRQHVSHDQGFVGRYSVMTTTSIGVLCGIAGAIALSPIVGPLAGAAVGMGIMGAGLLLGAALKFVACRGVRHVYARDLARLEALAAPLNAMRRRTPAETELQRELAHLRYQILGSIDIAAALRSCAEQMPLFIINVVISVVASLVVHAIVSAIFGERAADHMPAGPVFMMPTLQRVPACRGDDEILSLREVHRDD